MLLGLEDIEKVIHQKPAISSDMFNAIQLWTQMYEGRASWLKDPTDDDPNKVVSLGLPALIASEKARMATLEMESEITAPMVDVEKDNPDYEPPGFDENGMPKMGKGSMKITESEPVGSTERADFLNLQYKKVLKRIRPQLEYACAKGGIIIKPYLVIYDDVEPSDKFSSDKDDGDKNASKQSIKFNSDKNKDSGNNSEDFKGNNKEKTNGSKEQNERVVGEIEDDESLSSKDPLPKYEFEFDFVQADKFFPMAFNSEGKITEAAFIQQKVDKDKLYTRLEYHKLEGRSVTVQNFAFVSNNVDMMGSNNILSSELKLGKEIPLTDVPEWSSLEPVVTIDEVDRPLFAYLKMPEANTIDTNSPIGVSCYSRVVRLIRDADEQYSRLLWEFEGGELAVDVDRDALRPETDSYGNIISKVPTKQQRLFRKVDLNSEETYEVFSPALRDASLINGLNTILTRIEDATGLSRGTISDVNYSEARTATELKILKQRSFQTNKDIQESLRDALEDVIYAMDVYCDLYDVTEDGRYEVSFEFDDSILIDSETELEKRMSMLSAGITSKVELRMWYFGETENQAKEALQKVDDEKKTSMETNITAQQELGDTAQGKDFSGDNNNSGDDSNGNQVNKNFGQK